MDAREDPNIQAFFLPKSLVNDRRQEREFYTDFAMHFISAVVGKRTFESRNSKFVFSRFVSVSDEAFALLVFENNYNRWLDMALRQDWTSSSVKPEYTTCGNVCQTPRHSHEVTPAKKTKNSKTDQVNKNNDEIENNASTSMYQGWSIQGIRRFNELYDLVMQERKSIVGPSFDDTFLQYCIDRKSDSKKRVNKKPSVFEVCRHDLWVDNIIEEKSTEVVLVSEKIENNEIKEDQETAEEDESKEEAQEEPNDHEEDDDLDGYKAVTGIEV